MIELTKHDKKKIMVRSEDIESIEQLTDEGCFVVVNGTAFWVKEPYDEVKASVLETMYKEKEILDE